MKIAVLLADTVKVDRHGNFGDMCKRMIQGVCSGAELDIFDAVAMQRPSDLSEYCGVIITSSTTCSAFDSEPWVQHLQEYVRMLDQANVRMVGLAFGHQIIAQALGGVVERNPRGWEVGWKSFPLTTAACRRLGGLCSWDGEKQIVQLLYFHQDHVKQLPAGAVPLGGTKLCAIEGFVKGDHILTFQGQPEFSVDVLEALLDAGLCPPDLCHEAKELTLQALRKPTDAEFVALRLTEFFNNPRHGHS